MNSLTRKLEPLPLEELNRLLPGTIMEVLGIRVTGVGDDFVEGTMPVDSHTHQVHGLLHGGASVVLAESLGSIGAMLCTDRTRFRCVGVEVYANHVTAVTSGTVTGVARPLHIGRSTQVWDIRITNESGRLVCVSRLTMAVVPATP